MSRPFDDYPAGPSYSPSANASWHSHQNMPYDYPSPYDIYASGASAATLGEAATTTSAFSGSATFSPSYDYADSPFSFDEFDATPLSPSSSASSSSSSCSDAPVTPYYQPRGGIPLPQVGMLYTALDATAGGDYCDSTLAESAYGYEGWEEEDATQRYCGASMPESSLRSSAIHAEYNNSDALWACESAIAQLQYFDAPPGSGFSPDPPTYASSDLPAVTSSAISPPHAQEYPPVSCLSPAALTSPPPLKVHQPQPRRSIPVVSLSALASGTENIPQSSSPFERTTISPAISPLEHQFPSLHAQGVGSMTSYSDLPSADSLPMAAYLSRCPCPACTEPFRFPKHSHYVHL
ncbi:hypothetical protein FB451DRAFT_522189 [Mycena latifolia]|nr:hypothetical protein FB451DRAFT_522189 [Mycena latifolia]